MRRVVLPFFCFCISVSYAQDSLTVNTTQAQRYEFKNTTYSYQRPNKFQVVTGIPRTFAASAKLLLNKKTILPAAAITASTLLLLRTDQSISNSFHNFYTANGIQNERDYKTLIALKIGGNKIDLYDVPRNLNSVFYSIGEGSTTLLLAGGLSLAGHFKNDFRLLHTSNELVQSLVILGVTTQMMKYFSGRESPFVATRDGGAWRPFPSPSSFFHHKREYDAFPSGHMATMMATVTILSENFGERKWIKPVGYALMGVVGAAMIGNDVHWMSDYPLAIGTGYLVGKAAVKLNRVVRKHQ